MLVCTSKVGVNKIIVKEHFKTERYFNLHYYYGTNLYILHEHLCDQIFSVEMELNPKVYEWWILKMC